MGKRAKTDKYSTENAKNIIGYNAKYCHSFQNIQQSISVIGASSSPVYLTKFEL